MISESEITDKKALSENVITFTVPDWVLFFRREEAKYKSVGKYLFFSPNREKLTNIAIDELENNGFHHAKMNTLKTRIGNDNVLCLYYKDDSRVIELADKYKGIQEVKYRYWKTDVDTIIPNSILAN